MEMNNRKIIVVDGAGAEFEMARALGALTLQKPFERKAILQAIEQLQNQIVHTVRRYNANTL
jgi:Zn-dependent alcohol dehydrogenase